MKRVLDPSFRYVPSHSTDVRKTFARVPIILTSRADAVTTRLASCAVAVLAANARRASASKALG